MIVGTSSAGDPPWTSGVEPLSYGIDNGYVFPVVATGNNGVQGLTPVGGLANWQIAAQIPANAANYNENATNVVQTDDYDANSIVLPTDTVLAMCMYERAQLTDMTITTISGTWTEATGINVATPTSLPGTYATLATDVWTTRQDLTSITPADVTTAVVKIGVTLAP